jgi:AI-2 transport protein TqsA
MMQAHDRFRNLVYGMALAIMVGWILYIGQNVFVPVIASVISPISSPPWPGAWSSFPVIGQRCPARSATRFRS